MYCSVPFTKIDIFNKVLVMLTKAKQRRYNAIDIEMNPEAEQVEPIETEPQSRMDVIRHIINDKWSWWWAVIGCINKR